MNNVSNPLRDRAIEELEEVGLDDLASRLNLHTEEDAAAYVLNRLEEAIDVANAAGFPALERLLDPACRAVQTLVSKLDEAAYLSDRARDAEESDEG